MSWYRAFLAFFCAVAASVSCLAQDRETLLDDFPLAPFRFAGIDLKVGLSAPSEFESQYMTGLLHRPPRIDEIYLLNKEWVHDELGFRQSQIQNFRDEYNRIHNNRLPVPTDLLESLDSKQREKFLDIRIRCRIRAMGIVEFFSQQLLGLSKEELDAVRELVTELEPIYTERCTELRDKTLQKLRDVLSKEQQAQLDNWSLGFLESRPPSLDLLAWQMRNMQRFEETVFDQRLPNLRGFFVGTGYFIDYDGVLEEETYLTGTSDLKRKLTDREQKLRDAYISQQVFLKLHRIIVDESISGEIESTNEQIEFANSVVERLQIFETKWFETVFPINRAGTQEGNEVYAEYERRKAELIAEGTRDLESIFLPHQRRFLETLGILFEVFRGGYPSAIVYGQTGRTLKLTSKQKGEIELICKESVSEIESQTRNWEKEIFSKLKDSFSDNRKEELEFLFNCPISQGQVNIYLLLKGGL
ncbi:MAG: hypothetical protein KF851_13545 [Pirellulaceae bacterium]|nr:hypothetical protein [Pirellulaceae bacterium]